MVEALHVAVQADAGRLAGAQVQVRGAGAVGEAEQLYLISMRSPPGKARSKLHANADARADALPGARDPAR